VKNLHTALKKEILIMKNNATVNQVILTSLYLITLVYSSYADIENKPALRKKKGGLPYNQLWRKTDVRKYLKLPYDKKFGKDKLITSMDKFQSLDGISGFAIVSKLEQLSPNDSSLGGALFSVCNTDLSIFQVDIYNPISCKSACDLLFKWVTSTLSLWNNVPKVYLPQHNNDNENIYTLLDYTRPQKWYLNIKRGIIIHVRYDASSKWLKKDTPNNDLLIKQIDLIINGLISFLDGKYKITDKQKAEYSKIREKYKTSKEELGKERDAERRERLKRWREKRRKTPSKAAIRRMTRKIIEQEKAENKCKLTDAEIKNAFKYFLKKKKITLASFSKTATSLTRIVEGLYIVVKEKKTPQQVYSQLNMSKYDISREVWIGYTQKYKAIKSIDSLKGNIPNNMDIIIERGKKAFRPKLEDWLLLEKIITYFNAKFPQDKSLSTIEKERKWWAITLKKYKLDTKTYNYILSHITLSRSSSATDKKIMEEYFESLKRKTK